MNIAGVAVQVGTRIKEVPDGIEITTEGHEPTTLRSHTLEGVASALDMTGVRFRVNEEADQLEIERIIVPGQAS